MNIRKSTSNLSKSEIHELTSAFLKLKKEGNPKSGRNYDTYVKWHQKYAMPAHMSPQFLPWHRIYLYLMEKDLQDVSGNSNLTIPYWDWRAAESEHNSLWSSEFLGGNGDQKDDWKVKDGPFAFDTGNWELSINDVENVNYLQRSFGRYTCDLPTSRDINNLLKVEKYDCPPWDRMSDINKSFRNRLEGWGIQSQLHNKGHVWIGGSMYEMTSPNDPVFFFHHCFVDLLWASWQSINPEEPYLTKSPDGANEALTPLINQNSDPYKVVDCLKWTDLGFDYDDLITITISTNNDGFYDR